MRIWFLIPLLALPWLNPVALGPVPAMAQTIVTALCAIWLVSYAGHTHAAFGKSFAALVAAAWVLAASLSAVAGLLQYFGWSVEFSPWVSIAPAGEAYANLRQRNQLATLLNIGMAALLWGLQAGLAQWHVHVAAATQQRALRAIACCLAALLAAATAASASRTGLVQLLVMAALVYFWGPKEWRHGQVAARQLMGVALVAFAVASFLLPTLLGLDSSQSGILSRLRPGELACTSRLVLWSNVLHLIAEKPWFGWGPGELSYAHFNTLYAGPRFCEILDNAHNLPLHVAVVVGVPGALALGAALAWWIYRARPWSEVDADRRLAWMVLALIALHSMLEYPLWYAPFQLAVFLCALLLWGAPRRQAWLGSGAAQALASVGFGLCAYTAWDYWRISQIYLAAVDRAPAYQTETLQKIQGSWLFRKQVRFADLGLATLTPENAQQILELSKDMLHFSPESMVVEKILDSARMLGRTEDIEYYLPRYSAAYPDAYAAWRHGH